MNTLILNVSNAFREFPSGTVVKNLLANTGDARDLSSIPGLGISPGVGNGCSIQFSCSVMSNSLRPHGLQHARLPCPSPTPGVCSNSFSSSRWCHPTISASVILFSFCLQSFPASGSFQMSQFFVSCGQSIGASAAASVFPRSSYEKAVATHSSVLAWRISWTEEPGGLQSMGLHWVKHNWACVHILMSWMIVF